MRYYISDEFMDEIDDEILYRDDYFLLNGDKITEEEIEECLSDL